MRIFWRLLWIAFLFFVSLAFVVAGVAAALLVGFIVFMLNRRLERGLTNAQAPDIRIYSNTDGTLAPRSPETANAR